MTLVFIGRLTQYPSGKSYLEACKHNGMQWFLVQDDEFFSPAWKVPCSPDAGEVNCELTHKDINVNVKQGTANLPVELRVWSLVCKCNSAAPLVRPKLPSEIAKPGAAKAVKTMPWHERVFAAANWSGADSGGGGGGAPKKGQAKPTDTVDKWKHIRAINPF